MPDIDFEAEHDPERAKSRSRMQVLRYAKNELGMDVSHHERPQRGQDATANVQRAAKESGAPLPGDLRGRFESSLGADLSSVRVHTGATSATAAESVGAKAYTTGQDIHFGAGEYDPSSKDGQRLLAHEVAHTVQQGSAGNAQPQAKLEVSAPADAHEQEADRAADSMLVGTPASVSPLGAALVQRKPATEAMEERYDAFDASWQQQLETHGDPHSGNLTGGGSHKDTELDHHHAGDAGYAARLGNAGSKAAHDAMAKGDYGTAAPPIEPYTEPLDRAMNAQTEWISTKRTETEKKRYNAANKSLGLGQMGTDPDWVTRHKENSLTRAGAQMTMLERHMFEQDYWVNSYNAWTPVANEVQTARADLIETAGMLGFDLGKPDDMVRFVQGIEHGLDNATALVDAKVLGSNHDASWSGRQDDKGKIGDGPQMQGEAVAPEFEQLRRDYEAVSEAQMGVYQNLLHARTGELEGMKGAKESKVNEINGVIQFWTSMASAYESGVAGFDPMVGSVETKINQYAGQSRARRFEGQAAKDSQAGHHAKARMNMGRADVARETSAPATEAGGAGAVQMPSFSGMVEGLTSYAFEDELNQLKGQIDMLSKHISAQKAVGAMLEAKRKIDTYASARRKLAETAKRVKSASLAKRETQYLQAGDALDRYAREHVSTLKAKGQGGLAPKDRKHEMYSHLMLIVAKVRAYLLLSDSARKMFKYDEFVSTALQLSKERRNADASPEVQAAPSDYFWTPPRVAPMTRAENKQVWEVIDGSYATIFGYAERAKIQFGPIEDKVTGLLQKMKGVESKNGDAPENEH